LVTTWPWSSHTKPLPVPRGTSLTRRVQKSRTRAVVVMLTTEGLTDSKIAIVFCSSAARSPRAVTSRGAGAGLNQRSVAGQANSTSAPTTTPAITTRCQARRRGVAVSQWSWSLIGIRILAGP